MVVCAIQAHVGTGKSTGFYLFSRFRFDVSLTGFLLRRIACRYVNGQHVLKSQMYGFCQSESHMLNYFYSGSLLFRASRGVLAFQKYLKLLNLNFRWESANFRLESASLRLESANFNLASANLRLSSANLRLESAGFRLESVNLHLESANLRCENANRNRGTATFPFHTWPSCFFFARRE